MGKHDLNVGAIVALSPALDAATKAEFNTWGPGKYDPRHHAFDGTNIIPLNSPSLPIVIPPIYGLKGVGFETYTGRRPDLVLEQLRRRRTDGRPGLVQRSAHRPLHQAEARPRHAEAAGAARLSAEPRDACSSEEAASTAPRRSAAGGCSAMKRGCASCHQGPNVYRCAQRSQARPAGAARSRRSRHRAGLRRAERHRQVSDDAAAGLWQHAPYFHDGSAPDLLAVVNHYDQQFGLNLSEAQKADLVEFLKSL